MQKQAVIKLIEKKDNKGFIKNWRLIFLLNVNYRIISKALVSRLKKVIPNLISPHCYYYYYYYFYSFKKEIGLLSHKYIESN